MKKTLIVILAISLVLLGAAFGLRGITHSFAQEDHIKLMELLLPDGKDFIKLTYTGEDKNIRSVHKASNGYVVETVTNGYADEITMLIGVDNNGTVTGVLVKEAHETFGLGGEILSDHVFLSQFLNKSGNFTVGKVESDDHDAFSGATGDSAVASGEEFAVDGISGATVSSKAVARCVNSAVSFVTGADVESSATEWEG